MRTSYGYDTYRGRSKMRTFLTVLIVILVVVLLLALAAFFLLQDHIYYSADGQVHIDLPFLQGKPAPSQEPIPSQSIVIVTPEPSQASPVPTDAPLTLISLPASALTDGTAADQVSAAGGNAALFDMKSDEGLLSYVSALPQATRLGTSAADPGLNKAIQALNETEGLYTVARVSCFRDNTAPRMDNSLAIRTSIGNWRDAAAVRWMSPAVAEVGTYLAGICQELAELGFDEIWLDNASYPTAGDLAFITRNERYEPSDFTSSLDDFYSRIQAALAGHPEVKLSLSLTQTVFTGGQDDSGQTLDLAKKYAQRLYVPGPEDEPASRRYDDARTALGMTPAQVVFATQPYTPEAASSYLPSGGTLVKP